MIRILMVGDIVGAPGRTIFARTVARLKRERKADLVVANAENAAGGKGLTRALAEELTAAGADILTLGDHAWDQREFLREIAQLDNVVRPANYPPGAPGRGWVTRECKGIKVTVMALLGRVFMTPFVECPFRTADAILTREPGLGRVVLVDMHAEATSEKTAMGRHLDGRVTAVCGTHTHVQTADETVLPGGTAYLTDLGMTGPKDSIIGRTTDTILRSFLTGLPVRFEVADGHPQLEGALLEVDEATGRCRAIRRIREGEARDGA